MSWKRITVSSIMVMIFVLSVIFAVSNIPVTGSESPQAPPVIPTMLPVGEPPVSPAQVGAEFAGVAVAATPHFYRTITYGSNKSSALDEDQAWRYAEKYFQTAGIKNIQSSEVIPLGQSVTMDEKNNETLIWRFVVKRIVSGVGSGGIIAIDADDGHVIDYSEL